MLDTSMEIALSISQEYQLPATGCTRVAKTWDLRPQGVHGVAIMFPLVTITSDHVRQAKGNHVYNTILLFILYAVREIHFCGFYIDSV